MFRQLAASHDRHDHIRQQEVDIVIGVVLDHPDGVFAIDGFQDFVALAFQRLDRKLSHRRLVLD